MKSCLIGYTGFVGSNLLRHFSFDELHNSSNIENIRAKNIDMLVCAGIPAAKWIANKNPEEDLNNINKLIDNLRGVKVDRFILISTVDVYNEPVNVNEDTHIDVSGLQPYGKHRLYFEEFVKSTFPKTNIVRLPGLFGAGLKKNAIYDLMHNNCLEMIHCDSVYQFYDLERLKSDLEVVLKYDLPLINFATQPVSIKEVAENAFEIKFDNETNKPPASYDVKTKYSSLFGSDLNYYLFSKKEILTQIRNFITSG
jgi:nucleoside-diphosphate-sugar epimerase